MNLVNLKAFIKELSLKKSTGQIKFAVISYFLSKGSIEQKLSVIEVRGKWIKSLLKSDFNSVFYSRAQEDGYVDCVEGEKGKFVITDKTISLVADLNAKEAMVSGELKKTGALYVVNRKGTHSFDKFLRYILSEAKTEVQIADSYVNDSIFFNILDKISKDAVIKLIYNNVDDLNKFNISLKRFKTEYNKFEFKKYKYLHDRFIIVDNIGYIMGPSIKDAASQSPALIVQLGGKETVSLKDFFKTLWKVSKD